MPPSVEQMESTEASLTTTPALNDKSRPHYRDNASVILPQRVDPHVPDRDEQIRSISAEICPFLLEDGVVDVSHLQVKPLSGGLSNELFIVSSSRHCVLFRLHPSEHANDTQLVNREEENHLVAWLSRQGLAPKFYGRFENGRLEELYPDVETLTCLEMNDYATEIAEAMSRFHSVSIPSAVLPRPEIAPSRLETVDEWMKGIRDHPEEQLARRIVNEWKWLRAQLLEEPSTPSAEQQTALRFIREWTLTHMDCQSLNILKVGSSDDKNEKRPIKLIDFEYAGWNPKAADIANTFCEFCDMNNLKGDYAKQYPSEATQNAFLSKYLEPCAIEASPEVLETLRHEIGRFTLLSHLGWAAWSLVLDDGASNVDFDYLAYARHRLDGYEFHKEEFFS